MTLHKNDSPIRHRLTRNLGTTAVQLCTVEETGNLLRVSRWQVNELISKRRIDSIKIGRRRLVPLASIQAFIDQHRIGALT